MPSCSSQVNAILGAYEVVSCVITQVILLSAFRRVEAATLRRDP